MFPGAHSEIYRNEAGEVLGWDNHFYDEDPYESDDYIPDYEWQVQGMYMLEWEHLTTHDNEDDALEEARVYDENEPSIPHRVKKVKI